MTGRTYRRVQVETDVRHGHAEIGMRDAHHHHALREQIVPHGVTRHEVVAESLGRGGRIRRERVKKQKRVQEGTGRKNARMKCLSLHAHNSLTRPFQVRPPYAPNALPSFFFSITFSLDPPAYLCVLMQPSRRGCAWEHPFLVLAVNVPVCMGYVRRERRRLWGVEN